MHLKTHFEDYVSKTFGCNMIQSAKALPRASISGVILLDSVCYTVTLHGVHGGEKGPEWSTFHCTSVSHPSGMRSGFIIMTGTFVAIPCCCTGSPQ